LKKELNKASAWTILRRTAGHHKASRKDTSFSPQNNDWVTDGPPSRIEWKMR